jgi:transcriptional regulator with XRE-family HTH domain
MIIKYRDKYEHYEVFANKIGVSRATVNNWERVNGENIHAAKKEKIAAAFELKYEVWMDNYYTVHEFTQHLDDYLLEGTDITSEEIQQKMMGDIIRMSLEEEDELRLLVEQSPMSIPGYLEQYSPDFILALAFALKDKNQAYDALRVMDVLLQNEKVYKYKYYNQILHLRAILLSHEEIKKWDEAINILRLLYSACSYHLKEPEIITLTASNYKRKAFYDSKGNLCSAEKVDKDLIGQSISLYREAYRLKKVKDRYYDAVNLASLTMILATLEGTDINEAKKEVQLLYKKLSEEGWRTNDTCWWEVATKIEFKLLLGREDEAMFFLNAYLENRNKIQKFDVETTIRQLKIYVQFVADQKAEEFLRYLEECWLYLNE